MDNEKKPEQLNDDSWLDDLLGPQDAGGVIQPDDQAAMDAGLLDPNDLELEKLLAEFGAEMAEEVPGAPAAPETAVQEEVPFVSANPMDPEEPFRDEEFRNTFGAGETLEEAFVTPEVVAAPETVPAAPETEPEPVQPKKVQKWWQRKPPQKRRPTHKKGYGFFGIPHILATGIWLALAVIIGMTAGNVLWMMAADVLLSIRFPRR